MFAVIFYMFLKCSEYLTAYIVCHNRSNISGCYMTVNTRWNSGGAHCPSHLYLFPCIYRAKVFRPKIHKDSPHYHETQIFQQKIISICFPSN